MKYFFWFIEDLLWSLKCSYNLWLHGPYGLAREIEKMPFRFIVKYLRKYGATVGENCRFERGLNIHRPLGKKPFENLIIGNNVYLGHNTLIDLSGKVTIKDNVIIASRCQLWTHASFYGNNDINDPSYGEKYGDIVIEEYAIIYTNVLITHGINIGKFSRIGACSLVNKNVDKDTFVGGIPSRQLKNY